MTDSEWKERRNEVERYRLMARDATDPVAAALLHDVVSELEADLNKLADIEAQRTLARECVLEPGVIEIYGRTVSCLVRSLSEDGAAIDVINPGAVPDRFTLELPLEGATHRCRLVWRRETEIGVTFR